VYSTAVANGAMCSPASWYTDLSQASFARAHTRQLALGGVIA